MRSGGLSPSTPPADITPFTLSLSRNWQLAALPRCWAVDTFDSPRQFRALVFGV